MNTTRRRISTRAEREEYWDIAFSGAVRVAAALVFVLAALLAALYPFGQGAPVLGVIGLALTAVAAVAMVRLLVGKLAARPSIGIAAGCFVAALILDFLA